MASHPNAEFAQFRFVRDAPGNVISLPSQGTDERNLLVIDYDRWGLARLHIFEEAAVRKEKLEAFQDEFSNIAELRNDMLTRLVSWGRDGEELFYSDELLDGEPMPDYLGRVGGVPFAVAAEWIVQWIEFLESLPYECPSFERFSTLNFQMILDSHNEVRPVFSEFFGWTKPGGQVQEHTREWNLAQVFCSLIAGVPVRTFHDQSLPRNFDDLPGEVQAAVHGALKDGEPGAMEAFEVAMRNLAEKAGEVKKEVSLPRLAVREWLRGELRNSYPGEPEYEMSPEFSTGEERYGLHAVIRGTDTCVQLLPGPEYLPREGWLTQHHLATRRVGRAMMHQLHVNYIEDRGAVTLVGEEQIDGVDLGSLVRQMGAVSPEVAAMIGNRVAGTLDGLEGRPGSCAVWWLPPENVMIRTGTRSIAGSMGLIGRKGEQIWEEFPVKLRLHQTTRTLRKGVSLPSSIRKLSREPGKAFRETRRQAIALPLLFFLLTRERFRWRQPVPEQASLSPKISELFESARTSLLEAPEEIDGDFFEKFTATVAEGDSAPEVEEEPEAPREDGFEAMLKETLYQEKIDLTGVEGIPRPPVDREAPDSEQVSVESEVGGEEPEEKDKESENESGKEKSGGRPWWKFWSAQSLWMAFLAIPAALIAGYFLAGWNAEKGRYEVAEEPVFSLGAYREVPMPGEEDLLGKLEEYLIENARPDLIPEIAEWENPASRSILVSFLQSRVDEFDGEAAWLIAIHSAAMDKNREYHARLRRAAELGDSDAQVQVAEWVLLKGIPLVEAVQAKSFLKTASTKGNADACILLSRLLFKKGDLREAIRVLEPPMRDENVVAIYQCGLLHAMGEGGDAGKVQAVECFERAALLGGTRAMVALGQCLETGFGLPASFTEAARWMKMAAAAGDREALAWCRARRVEVHPVALREP